MHQHEHYLQLLVTWHIFAAAYKHALIMLVLSLCMRNVIFYVYYPVHYNFDALQFRFLLILDSVILET